MRKKYRADCRERLIIPEVYPLDKIVAKEDIHFYTQSGALIAKNYVRVVIGDRGPYIEFTGKHINHEALRIPASQEWRRSHRGCYYLELRSTDESYVKVYLQKRTVKYADYIIGCYYISPFDLTSDKYPILLTKEL